MMAPTRVFLHYLDRLDAMLRRIGSQADDAILQQRLHPDMLPLLQQARTAIGFTLRTTCPLAGRDIVSFANDDASLAGVLAQLDATRRYLAAIPDDAFDGIDDLRVATTAGFAELDLPGRDYYMLYALPNFFFHYAMVYAIARQAGVEVGKADFDGFHAYPPGFSWEKPTLP